MTRVTRQAHTLDKIGIYRISNKVGGYALHVTISRNGKIFNKRFDERQCGGADLALRLALSWRDRVIQAEPALSLARFCAIVRRNNTSGIAGVTRAVKQYRCKAGRVVTNEYWVARIPLEGGRTRSNHFAIRTFGEEEARKLAILARIDALNKLETVVFRAAMQPLPVSSEADMYALDAMLEMPAKRKAAKAKERLRRAQMECHQEQLRVQDRQRAAAEYDVALAAPTNCTGEPYIGRYTSSSGTTKNWRVSIQRNGRKYRKTFSDGVYGGADASLAAARAWRDDIFRSQPLQLAAATFARVNRTNTSGVAGVYLVRNSPKGAGESWVARSPTRKHEPIRSKRFSVAKYGSEQAFAMAVQARQVFLDELGELRYSHHRAAQKMEKTLRQR